MTTVFCGDAMTIQDRKSETRDRLLAAAGEVFAEHGFEHATVQEICRRADANIASVNYHFNGKEQLYAHVLHCFAGQAEPIMDAREEARVPPERRLEIYVHNFVSHLMGSEKPTWHARMMAREMAEPSAVFEQLIVPFIRQRFEYLSRIVRALIGPAAAEEEVARCVFSVVGQGLMFAHKRRVIARVSPVNVFAPDEVTAVASHITAFSLAAIKGLARQHKPRRAEKSRPARRRSAV